MKRLVRSIQVTGREGYQKEGQYKQLFLKGKDLPLSL